MLKRANVHDMDKLILYQFIDKKEASSYHKENASHHMTNNIPKTYFDKLEAVLDYESAGYTKPDKPLNAFDTINKFKKENILPELICNELLDICKEYNINSSYSVTKDEEGMKYLSKFEKVSEEEIFDEILIYFLMKSSKGSE